MNSPVLSPPCTAEGSAASPVEKTPRRSSRKKKAEEDDVLVVASESEGKSGIKENGQIDDEVEKTDSDGDGADDNYGSSSSSRE